MQQLGFDFGAPAADAQEPIKEIPPVTAVGDCEAYWWVTRGGMYGSWWRALPIAERDWWIAAHKEALQHVEMGQPMPRPEGWEQRRWTRSHPDEVIFSRIAHRNQAIRWADDIGNAYAKQQPVEVMVRKGGEWILRWAIEIAEVTPEFVINYVKIV